jgi:hypothetical protein
MVWATFVTSVAIYQAGLLCNGAANVTSTNVVPDATGLSA